MTGGLVVIGRVGKAHGLRGAVRAVPSGPNLGALAERSSVVLRAPGTVDRRLVIAAVQGTTSQPILSFDGIADRTGAEALRGADILVEAGRLLPLQDPETVYVRDLVGCEVRCAGAVLGRVVDVLPGPANDVLEVDGPDGRVLLPFTADAIPEMDLVGRLLTLRPGLLGGEP